MQRIPVPIPGHEYVVLLGRGLLARPGLWFPPRDTVSRAAIVSDDRVGPLYAGAVAEALGRMGVAHRTITVPAGESSKCMAVLEQLYHEFAAAGLDRGSVVTALGGGVIGDLAGFAAATYLRGLRLVQLPTSLLAQVDSSVGGKTGIDLEEGKNLVGAFFQPVSVAIDTETLRTLPQEQLRAGLAEVIKYGVIAEPEILDRLERRIDAVLAGAPEALEDLIERSVRIKAAVVAADEREAGRRAILNFGHTIGHALEAVTGYRTYLHGEAVSIGMAYALRLSQRKQGLPAGAVERVTRLLTACGLPITPRGPLEIDRLLAAARADKKAREGRLIFVLARELGDVDLAPVEDQELRELLEGTG